MQGRIIYIGIIHRYEYHKNFLTRCIDAEVIESGTKNRQP